MEDIYSDWSGENALTMQVKQQPGCSQEDRRNIDKVIKDKCLIVEPFYR